MRKRFAPVAMMTLGTMTLEAAAASTTTLIATTLIATTLTTTPLVAATPAPETWQPGHARVMDDVLRAPPKVDTAAWRGLRTGVDHAGRLLWWHSAATGRETRRLDEQGRTVQRRYANGDTWSFRHDSDGRLVEAIAASARGALRTAVDWRDGAVQRIEHPHENETRRHDAHGRLASRVVHRPALSARESGYAYREGYAWDAAGRLLRHDLPEGGSLTYERDAQGRLARIEWQEGTRRRALPLPAPCCAMPLLRQRLQHDPRGRLTGQHLHIGDWHAAWAYAYGDGDGDGDGDGARIIAAAARLRGVPALRAVAGQGGDDAAAAAPEVRRWMYAWRASGASPATRAGTQTTRHIAQRDASGLPMRIGPRHVQYGPDRRLRSVWENGRELARYLHNTHGERIRRDDAAGSRHYLYVQHRLAAEARPLSGGGVGVTRRYVYTGETPIAIIEYPRPRPLPPRPGPATSVSASVSPPVFYRVHTAADGVARAVTDDAHRLRWRALMSPTGALLAEEGDVPMPLRRPGHIQDEATGWHHGPRTYDPQAGHYLEPDPAGPAKGGSPYGYPGAREQAVGAGARLLPALARPDADDGDPARDEAVTVDMRGYSRWLRDALAPEAQGHGGNEGG